jgi:hypothetical protein
MTVPIGMNEAFNNLVEYYVTHGPMIDSLLRNDDIALRITAMINWYHDPKRSSDFGQFKEMLSPILDWYVDWLSLEYDIKCNIPYADSEMERSRKITYLDKMRESWIMFTSR